MEKGNCDRAPKALILDCGGVLAYPTHGDWTFPPAMMESLRAFPARDVVIARARAALEWLDESEKLDSLEEEDGLRLGYLRAATNDLGLYMENEVLAQGAHWITYTPECYSLYADVLPVLEAWQGKYRLGLLSNAMPSMKKAMEALGALQWFDAAIASCEIGAIKPAHQMYEAILAALGVAPGEAVFVDDLPMNLEAARALGMRAVRMARPFYLEWMPPQDGSWDGECVSSFAELNAIL